MKLIRSPVTTTADPAEYKLLKQSSYWPKLKISLLIFLRKCKLVWHCINVFMSDYILIWFSSKMNTSRIQLKCHFCRKLWNRYDKFIIQAVNSRFWKYTSCNSILVFRVILMSLKHTNKTSTLPSKCNQWAFTIIITCFLWRTHTLITWLKFRMKIWGLESLFWRLLSSLKWKTVMN